MSAKKLLAVATCLPGLWMPLASTAANASDDSGSPGEKKILYDCPNLQQLSPLSSLKVGMFQGYDGWFFRTVDFETNYAVPSSILDFYTRLNAALSDRGIRLVIMTLPPRSLTVADEVPPQVADAVNFDPAAMRESFSEFLRVLRTSGAIVVDTVATLDEPDVGTFYFKRDLHWRPEGARKTAVAVRRALEKDEGFAEIASKSFTNEISVEDSALNSNVQLALLSMCRGEIPREHRPLYETSAGEASVEDFLGDDDKVPVAVVGTSFSDEGYLLNFTGFLREALKMEVAGYAISGGSVDQSIYQFLHSEAVSEQAPRYLIWELPFSGRIEEIPSNLARQLVPAAEGICEGNRTAAEAAYAIAAPGRIVLRPSPDAGKISGNRYYVAMTLSDPSIRNFVSFLRYDDGREEIFTIARPDRVPASDKLFIELSPEFSGSLEEVEVDTLDGGALSGSIRLCRAGSPSIAAVGN